jgi:hypothetical protein
MEGSVVGLAGKTEIELARPAEASAALWLTAFITASSPVMFLRSVSITPANSGYSQIDLSAQNLKKKRTIL